MTTIKTRLKAGISEQSGKARRRLSRDQRRRQLLDVALTIVREEGADRLTLGHLADRAAVSKPVVYDHFETRSVLLITLYRMIDMAKVRAFEDAMARGSHGAEATAGLLAQAYIECATETDGEFQSIGAALAGSGEKSAVFEELLANSVAMFVALLKPHSSLGDRDLHLCCIGLVGAGEALAAARLKGTCDEAEAVAALRRMLRCALN